jgi:hypothetical protein
MAYSQDLPGRDFNVRKTAEICRNH